MPDLVLGPVLRHVTSSSATIWVETDTACTVRVILSDVSGGGEGGTTAGAPASQASTFAVRGHHYALVVLEGLPEGTDAPYAVHLDDVPVWPPTSGPIAAWPVSRVRTTPLDGPRRIVLGSCRSASPPGATDTGIGRDCLDALAEALHDGGQEPPDLLLLLGDQVYADETSDRIRRKIAERRGTRSEPKGEIRDFEEYTWLYHESWGDPHVRWLLSTVPSAMIFDDHDVHDDWNTSASWRADARRTPWWGERIVGALESYFVYQHLGNLSPTELVEDATARALLSVPHPGLEVEPLLRRLAVAADAEADGAKGYRWSYVRDVGDTRVVVLDSRCGRILDGGTRLMMSDVDFAWAERELTREGAEHVVVATSLPWLLAPALDAIEGWNERMCASPGWRARVGETMRRGADLEHWAAFRASSDRLAEVLRRTASRTRPDGGSGPASVTVVSGDVHHSYVGRAVLDAGDDDDGGGDGGDAPVHQVTCSPLNNRVYAPMRLAFRLAWSERAERVVRRILSRVARVPAPSVGYRRVAGPVFGNAVATLTFDGRRASMQLASTETGRGDTLEEVLSLDLTASGSEPVLADGRPRVDGSVAGAHGSADGAHDAADGADDDEGSTGTGPSRGRRPEFTSPT